MGKVYSTIAAVALVTLVCHWVNGIIVDRDSYKAKLGTKTQELIDAKATLATERAATAEAVANAAIHQQNEERIRNEAKELQRCIDDKSCVAVVRVAVKSSCPSGGLSDKSSPSDPQYTYAELDPHASRIRADLEEGIKLREELYADCQRTLSLWAWPRPVPTNGKF